MARTSELTRKLDQGGGRVMAGLLGAWRRPRPLPDAPERILLIQPTAIGDTLISSGAIAALAARYPGAALTVAHGPSNAGAIRMLATPVSATQIGFTNPIKAVGAIRALEPDMIVDLTPWPYATALCARLSGTFTAGFEPAFSNRGQLFDLVVPHRTDRHEIDNLAAMAAALDSGETARRMIIRRNAGDLPEGIDSDGLVLLHVSAGGARAQAKSWPRAHWVTLMRALAADGWRVGLTGVPADSATVDPILAEAGLPETQVFSLCGKVSLSGLAELLARVPLLVSVDTGVLHLSAAVAGAAIGLHGPTRAARWGSISPRAKGLDAPHPAAGYIHYGWEDHPQELSIMVTLTPERVIETARRMLSPRSVA